MPSFRAPDHALRKALDRLSPVERHGRLAVVIVATARIVVASSLSPVVAHVCDRSDTAIRARESNERAEDLEFAFWLTLPLLMIVLLVQRTTRSVL